MCGMKRTSYGIPGESEGPDMVRMKGHARRIMQQADADEYLEELSEELDQLLDEKDPNKNAEAIGVLIDEMEAIESGRWLAPVPAYDPADERAVKVGHENPIHWQRAEEARVKEWKRRRRMA